jgi:hypothetical protein
MNDIDPWENIGKQRQELILELFRIIEDYLDDESIKQKLKGNLEETNERERNVKGILAEIERNRTINYSDKDAQIIKDIFFYLA